MLYFHAGPVGFHNKGSDLVLALAGDDLRRSLGHDDDYAGLSSVRAPQFFSVENESVTFGSRLGMSEHGGGVGTSAGFRESEGGDLAGGHTRQIFAFLGFGSEENERLGHADGLMGREQRGQVTAVTAEQHRGAAIVGLGKSQAPVLRGNLDAE